MAPIPDSLSDEQSALVQDIMDAHGFNELTQTQHEAFDEGILEPWNSLLVAETGNGKTLTAEAVTKQTLDVGGKVAYLVPSYQLTKAKEEEINEWADDYTVGTGGGAIKYADVAVSTFESFFQTILRDVGSARSVDRVVLDDFHEIYSRHRGPGIEKAITAILDANIRVYGMSATLGNAAELSEWLDAELIESSENRGIPIEEIPVEIDGRKRSKQVEDLMKEHDEKGPFLIFNSSRRNAESRASDIADTGMFDGGEKNYRKEIEKAVSTTLTKKHNDLAEMMNNGVAYHHSGLESGVRDLIITAIEDGDLKALFCTPGLAYGFDAPIQSVVVADLKLWNGQFMDYIGVWQYIQWIGRAGRPGYGFDPGYAFPMWSDYEQAFDQFQFGSDVEEKELESVETHIEDDERFRWLLLELVEMGWDTAEEIEEFLQNTLYWAQMEPSGAWGRELVEPEERLQQKLRETADWLEDNKFIAELTSSGRFKTTNLGTAAVNFSHATWLDVSLESVQQFTTWIENDELRPLEAIQFVTETFNMALGDTTEDQSVINNIQQHGLKNDEYGQTAALLGWYWCEGVSVDEVEEQLDVDAGYMSKTASDIAALLRAGKNLFDALPNERLPDWYDTFLTQLDNGIRAEDVYLVESVDGLGRSRVSNLTSPMRRLMVSNSSFDDDLQNKPLIVQLQALQNDVDGTQFKDTVKSAGNIGNVISERVLQAVTDWNGSFDGFDVPPIDAGADMESLSQPQSSTEESEELSIDTTQKTSLSDFN